MRPEEIADFVKRHVEPLLPSPSHGARYRVAGTLTDGTALPCIVVESAMARLDLVIRRLGKESTPDLLRTFIAQGNIINDFDLRQLSLSRFAIPAPHLKQIGGETSMGWTEFHAAMTDGSEHRFGTQFRTEFFDMPDGYAAADIARIVPTTRSAPAGQERICRERPFFTCYIDGL